MANRETREVVAVGVVTSDTILPEKKTELKVEAEKSELQKEAAEISTSTTGLVVAGISTEESKKLEKRVEDLEGQLDEKEKAISKLEKGQSELNEVIQNLRSESGNKDIVSRDFL